MCNSDGDDIDWLSKDCRLEMNAFVTETYPPLGAVWPILGVLESAVFNLSDDCRDEEEQKHGDSEQAISDHDRSGLTAEWIPCDLAIHESVSKEAFSGYIVPPNYALRHRRSALEFVPQTGAFKVFREACVLMRNVKVPFGYLCCYILYVIRVDNVQSGLYLLFPKHAVKYEAIYCAHILEETQQQIVTIELVQRELYLHLVKGMEEEEVAKMSSDMACHQRLCANAHFTIDLCVDLEVALQSGEHYNGCHWECGYVGQLMYVHMELYGLGATAIGCYLDDYASANVGFLPQPTVNEDDDGQQQKKRVISPDELSRFDEWKHPLKNVRSLCHFSCGTPTKDSRYPYFSWNADLFAFDAL